MAVPIANIMEPADWQDREMERLEAENAKLRDELDFCLKYAPNCDECAAMLDCDECLRADASQKERKRLAAENAKLRELVRDMADAIVDWYDLMDGAFACESVYEDEKFAPLFDRMRELGIEVDDVAR